MKTIRNITHLIFALLAFASVGLTPSIRGGGINPSEALFDYSNSPLMHGNDVAFPEPPEPLVLGDAISKRSDDTFVIDRAGTYRVTYGVSVAEGHGRIFLTVDNRPVGPVMDVASSSSLDRVPVSETMLIRATAGDTIKLEVRSVVGVIHIYAASIEIEKLN